MNANSKRALFLMCAAACSGSVVAMETEKTTLNSIRVLESRDDAIAKFDAGWSMDSKFMSYGLVDNKDPIITPHASVVFMDWLGLGASAIFDTTKYGRKAGYSNRGGKYIELDPEVTLTHGFSPDDCAFLPTTVEFSLAYMYEYHPRAMGGATGEPGDDTQFITLQFALPDLWAEPILTFERDIDRDDGTYVNPDYVFDATLREAARRYEAHGRNRTSYNFITGLALCASF